MIDSENVASTCMDSTESLRTSLHAFHKAKRDNTDLMMWKSDIEATYHNLWLSKEWQAKQTVTIGDKHYVNHCFGNCSSYKVFLLLSSLIVWIAEYVKQIPHLKVYVDDNASFALAGNVLYYKPYHCYFPTNQTKLLLLWDELNIPHAKKKQIYGPIIHFVGLDIDPNKRVISISDKCCSNLIVKVFAFAKLGKHYPLWEFKSLADHLNWSFMFSHFSNPLFLPSIKNIWQTTLSCPHLHQ